MTSIWRRKSSACRDTRGMQKDLCYNKQMTLDAKIEAVLFFKGEPVSLKKLAEILHSDIEKVTEAGVVLEEKLKERGIQLVHKENELMLGTHPDIGPIIE